MENKEFVHLHLHSQYSLLQGALHVEDMLDRVIKNGMNAVAVTDTHNLFGAVDFYLKAKKAKVKPIIGCEILFTSGNRLTAYQNQLSNSVGSSGGAPSGGLHSGVKPKFHHLILLCKDISGYQNLCKLISRSYQEAPAIQKGQPSGPRHLIDADLLSQYGDGLIVLSGCIRGEIPYHYFSGEEAVALEKMQWFKKRFGDDFYLELQESGIPEQQNLNEWLYDNGKKLGIQCVATNDCHYLDACDHEAHEILQCIEHGRSLDFERPKSLVPKEFGLKTAQEMFEKFSRFPGVCENTVKIAEKCNVEFRFKDEEGRPIYHLPQFRPEGVLKTDPFDTNAYFREQTKLGLIERFDSPQFIEKKSDPNWEEKQKEYFERLENELGMIERTGFAGYFLIVSDFIKWAKKNDIPVGPGRGSGAGSLVAYSLKITDLDPIEFKLLFERFINPERISMPDFDVDFCQDRRGDVIDYVSSKYGKDNVCQIITFGKLQARAVLKDVGRVLGFSFAETDALTKLLPDELNITLSSALEKEPRFKEKIDQDPRAAKVVEYALKLEGLYRNAGIHAAGVIITEEPVVNYCPLFVGRDGDVVTQFDKDSAESIGLVKFDFLGLKTLTVIDYAVKLVRKTALDFQGETTEKETSAKNFDLDRINYKDPEVFALISSGDTDGVFQVESSGMKDLCSRIQPGNLEDITAINALYRPGPLGSGMVDDFIDRKHGRKPIVYDVPALEGILKDTYGVILYQEQVMQIARELAGYSLGQADLLRRAMGKKKPEEMAMHREIFVKGATERGIETQKAEGIFDLMAKFAEYGFNKSHSAAYGVLTYQTAYLKRYYPAEFMAALMTTEMDNTDKITKYISDAQAHGIKVLPPDVNRSQKRFSVERYNGSNKAIRCGLEAIKGVGGVAVDALIESRENQGPFKNTMDFCKRVSTRKANKKVMESLTLSGAFEGIAEVNRATLFASLEKLLEVASDEQEERELGQSSLFDSFSADQVKLVTPIGSVFKEEADWPRSKKLAQEKQTVGFYVSGHPMDTWQKIAEDWLGWSTEKLKEHAEKAKTAQPKKAEPQEFIPGMPPQRYSRPVRQELRIAGLVGELKEVTTKKGSRMAFASLEDLKGKVELIFFPEAFAQCGELLKSALGEAEPIVVTGEIELGDEQPKILVKALEWIEDAHRYRVQGITLHLKPSEISQDQLRALKRNLLHNRGKCAVKIHFTDSKFKTTLTLPNTVAVTASPQFVESVNKLFGKDVVQLH